MKGEFYKLDYEAWDEGTIDLSLEEEGAYLRICNNLYRRGGAFPNSERLLCSLWRCHPNKARTLLAKLVEGGKIELVDGTIRNRRVSIEIDARAKISIDRATSGRVGGVKSGETRRTPDRHPPDTRQTLSDTGPTQSQAESSKSLKNMEAPEAFASTPLKERREEERRKDISSLRSESVKSAEKAFEEKFWPAYPRRVAKDAARKAFVRIVASGRSSVETIVEGAQALASKSAGKDLEFIPHPATWLNAGRFDDEEPQRGTIAANGVPESGTRSSAGVWLRRDDPRFDRWIAYRRQRGQPPPALDRNNGWWFPSEDPPADERQLKLA